MAGFSVQQIGRVALAVLALDGFQLAAAGAHQPWADDALTGVPAAEPRLVRRMKLLHLFGKNDKSAQDETDPNYYFTQKDRDGVNRDVAQDKKTAEAYRKNPDPSFESYYKDKEDQEWKNKFLMSPQGRAYDIRSLHGPAWAKGTIWHLNRLPKKARIANAQHEAWVNSVASKWHENPVYNNELDREGQRRDVARFNKILGAIQERHGLKQKPHLSSLPEDLRSRYLAPQGSAAQVATYDQQKEAIEDFKKKTLASGQKSRSLSY